MRRVRRNAKTDQIRMRSLSYTYKFIYVLLFHVITFLLFFHFSNDNDLKVEYCVDKKCDLIIDTRYILEKIGNWKYLISTLFIIYINWWSHSIIDALVDLKLLNESHIYYESVDKDIESSRIRNSNVNFIEKHSRNTYKNACIFSLILITLLFISSFFICKFHFKLTWLFSYVISLFVLNLHTIIYFIIFVLNGGCKLISLPFFCCFKCITCCRNSKN